MKNSSVRATKTAAGKRGKPNARAKARASMENLFGMEEEEMARLYNEQMAQSKESSSSTQTKSTIDPTSLNDNEKTTPKRRSTKAKSKRTIASSSDKTILTEENKGILFQTQENVSKENQGVVTEAKNLEADSLDRTASRTLENPVHESEADDFEYTFELTNEEVDGVSKHMSTQLSKDLSLEEEDEFFVELSDLEFGEDYPLDETPDNDKDITHKGLEQEDRGTSEVAMEVISSAEDESFELPDDNTQKQDPEVESKEVESVIETKAQASQENAAHNKENSYKESMEDEKFDIDELINAGTNTYSPSAKERRNVLEYQVSTPTRVKDISGSEDVEDDILTFESDPIIAVNTSQQTRYASNNNESNLLPFGKYDMLQQILHAWAFGDTLELIQLGQESSLDDEPFYNGDDDDFLSHHNSANTKQTTKAEVIEHPLARYGLKVRTINAIELVGKENYYSLSEESRKELELMVQDLSKTEEGSARNTLLRQAIFGMFN